MKNLFVLVAGLVLSLPVFAADQCPMLDGTYGQCVSSSPDFTVDADQLTITSAQDLNGNTVYTVVTKNSQGTKSQSFVSDNKPYTTVEQEPVQNVEVDTTVTSVCRGNQLSSNVDAVAKDLKTGQPIMQMNVTMGLSRTEDGSLLMEMGLGGPSSPRVTCKKL